MSLWRRPLTRRVGEWTCVPGQEVHSRTTLPAWIWYTAKYVAVNWQPAFVLDELSDMKVAA